MYVISIMAETHQATHQGSSKACQHHHGSTISKGSIINKQTPSPSSGLHHIIRVLMGQQHDHHQHLWPLQGSPSGRLHITIVGIKDKHQTGVGINDKLYQQHRALSTGAILDHFQVTTVQTTVHTPANTCLQYIISSPDLVQRLHCISHREIAELHAQVYRTVQR